jgi:hypothetical protein
VAHDRIAELVNRYEHNELDQLLLVVEQLGVAAALLRTGSIADARAALILLDHHSEILLHRHCESLFRAGDGKGPFVGRAFTQRERERIRGQFNRKVDVGAGVGPLGVGVASVLDADAAACLKLAHRHRNAAYHGDRHNPGVLRLISLLQLDAVCRLLPATTPAIAFGMSADRVPPGLVRHGVRSAPSHGQGSVVDLREAARCVAVSVTAELELPLPAVRAELAGDLLERGGAAIDVLRELLDGGLAPQNLYFAIEHSEFWEKHGSDEQLVELLQRSDPWHRRKPDDPPGLLSDEVEADMARANHLRNERYVELRRQFRPRARQRAVIAAVEQSETVLHAATIADAIDRYDRLDRELEVFERYLPAAVRAFDAMVERQIDAAFDR